MNNNTYILKESSHGYTSADIDSELLLSRKIFLTGIVDADSMDSLFKKLMYLHKEAPEKEITIYINSPGGDVRSGLAVYDLIKLMKTPIHTVCIGDAASMGAVLFLAGDRRSMLPNSQIMIHDPYIEGNSLQGLKPSEIDEISDRLRKMKKVICDVISESTGRPVEEIMELTKRDCFYNAAEALDFGLTQEITDSI